MSSPGNEEPCRRFIINNNLAHKESVISMKKQRAFTLVEIMIVVVIIGLLAVMAVPAFKKVRATSQKNVVINNLRQIHSAAQQYMLEEGKASVVVSDLIDGNYLKSTPQPIAGEVYNTLTINTDQASLSIAIPGLGGELVYYNH